MNNAKFDTKTIFVAGTPMIRNNTFSTSNSTYSVNGTIVTHSNKPFDTQKIADAVYSYIQAFRVLGRTTISSVDISQALDIPLPQIHKSLKDLHGRGVKIVK